MVVRGFVSTNHVWFAGKQKSVVIKGSMPIGGSYLIVTLSVSFR